MEFFFLQERGFPLNSYLRADARQPARGPPLVVVVVVVVVGVVVVVVVVVAADGCMLLQSRW